MFTRYVLGYLRSMGIDVRVVQTDNGVEFVGGWQSKGAECIYEGC